MDKFNAMLYFKGEGSLTFILKKVGEITIYEDKPIYLTGLDVSQVEALRNLRTLKLEHKLNAKSDGCYRVINCSTSKLDEYSKLRSEHLKSKQKMETKEELAQDITNIKKSGLNGPIPEESIETLDESADESIDLGEHVLTSTKHKGKKIKDLSIQQIKSNLNKANEEDKKAFEDFLSQK